MSDVVVKEPDGGLAIFAGEDLAGFEEKLTQDDVAIPFIQILQSLSPQCVDGDPLFIADARPGMFINTVTGELKAGKPSTDGTPFGFEFIPISYKDSFIEWVPRAKGGGFVKEYDLDAGKTIITSRNELNQDIIQQGSPLGQPGNQLNRTHTHVVGLIKGDVIEPAVISMTSTQLKSSKVLNALVTNNPVKTANGMVSIRFAHVIKAATQMRSNDQGKWFVWDFERVGNIANKAHYDFVKNFASGLKAGQHKVDLSQAQSEGATAAPAGSGKLDEEVPF
jgi:hypothetical protein